MRKVRERRSPPGLEWTVLKKIPIALAAGTAIPGFMAMFARVNPFPELVRDPERFVASIDILAISLVVTTWVAALTITIGCVMICVMKGPTYEADSYPLEDSDRPYSDTDEHPR